MIEGLDHSQAVGRELYGPLTRLAQAVVIGARHVDSDVSGELEAHPLGFVDGSLELGRNLVGSQFRRAWHCFQLLGTHAQSHAIALEVAEEIGAIQLELA